jgi:hypothetical protein
MIQPQHQAEASAQRSAHQALPRGGADGGEVRNGMECVRAPGPVPIKMSMRKSSSAA